MLCDVIFLVTLQGKVEIDHLGVKGLSCYTAAEFVSSRIYKKKCQVVSSSSVDRRFRVMVTFIFVGSAL